MKYMYSHSIELYSLSQSIDLSNVGEHVVNIVSIWWVISSVPVLRSWTVTREDVLLQFTLIINAIKPDNLQYSKDKSFVAKFQLYKEIRKYIMNKILSLPAVETCATSHVIWD